jgi:hypothetical protein
MTTNALIGRIAATLGIAVLSMMLPFLFIPTLLCGKKLGLSPDEIWLVKVAGTALLPFGAVLWLITISNLIFRRRAGLVWQVLVFFGTAFLVWLLLCTGVYAIHF